jgi:uncharacterized protein (TIGR00255 family)
MIKSMTGFGRAEHKNSDGLVSAEARSVNNRYAEISVRLPKSFAPLEQKVKDLALKRLSRGSVAITVSYSGRNSQGLPEIDLKAARHYHKLLSELKKELKLSEQITLRTLVSFPEVLKAKSEEISEQRAWALAAPAVGKALQDLDRMRVREGQRLSLELRNRLLKSILPAVGQIEKRSPQKTEQFKRQLEQKMNKLLSGHHPDPRLIVQEAALYAQRIDVTEECVRLKSHIQAFAETLKQPQPAGRRMDFLLQEMNREVNTIGSKAGDAGISQLVVKLKEEIEKMREQVQNLE